mgnify:CR=1 FL=1
MSLFSRVLRSGEGKKVKALEALVPDINAVAERFDEEVIDFLASIKALSELSRHCP